MTDNDDRTENVASRADDAVSPIPETAPPTEQADGSFTAPAIKERAGLSSKIAIALGILIGLPIAAGAIYTIVLLVKIVLLFITCMDEGIPNIGP